MRRLLTALNWHLLIPSLALAAVLVFGLARAVDATLRVNPQDVAQRMGPIVPGSFHVIAQGDVPDGHLTIYTVRRPHHSGIGVGDVHEERSSGLFGPRSASGGEGYGPIQFHRGVFASGSDSSNTSVLYGYVPDQQFVAVIARLSKHAETRAAVTPQRGFFIVLPPGVVSPQILLQRRDGSLVPAR